MYASTGVAFAPSLLPLREKHPREAFAEPEDDAADDPLRTYLREIHEVSLLTAADERELACRIEERVGLYRMQALVRAALGREPTPVEVALGLCARLTEWCDLL